MKLYLATITHNHGQNFHIGLTEEQLYAELASYVRMNLFEMGEPPEYPDAVPDQELVEGYFADDKVLNVAQEFLDLGVPEEIGTLSMLPWDVAEGEPGDPRPWTVNLKTFDQTRIDIEATCPDGTKREVWIEIDKGNLVLHAYDPEHDEPVNVRIGKQITTVDSDRDEFPVTEMIEFVQQMARFTTPEQEFEDRKNKDGGIYDDGLTYHDVDEMVSEFDDERLCGEYHAFMDMIRAAKELVK